MEQRADITDEPVTGDEVGTTDEQRPGSETGAGVALGTLVCSVFTLVAVQIGLQALGDNSFLTHLATGRLILEGGSVPRADPYSWTAFGAPWTVQSWGASVVYAGLERTVGLVGIRILVAACCVALVLAVWKLTERCEGLIGRTLILALVVGIGAGTWVERPLTFGLVGLALVLLALEGRIDPRWAVPVMALWLNLHGSFVLGLGAIGCFWLGTLLDRRRLPEVETRVLAWAVGGTVLGAATPLGLDLLRFPVELLSRREAFEGIAEWSSPSWDLLVEQLFAVQLLLAVLLVALRGRTWRQILPVLVFGLMALQSTRNIAQASLVLVPAMSLAMQGVGSIASAQRVRLGRPVLGAVLGLTAVVAVVGISRPDVDTELYPVAAARFMVDEGLLSTETRVVSRDYVGNYLEARYGPDRVRVYIDDRVDMYPLSVIRSYRAMIRSSTDFGPLLESVAPSAVLWNTDEPMGAWLAGSDVWDVVYRDADWLVAVPAPGD